MLKVLQPGGTAHRIGSGLQYSMGGKTGTAQVVQIKQGKTYNAAALAEQHRDHAWFISFAPLNQPSIAIAVILENGGWGANAAPVARHLTDYYLLKLKGNANSSIAAEPPAVMAPAQSASQTEINPLLVSSASNTAPAAHQSAFQRAYSSIHPTSQPASSPDDAPASGNQP